MNVRFPKLAAIEANLGMTVVDYANKYRKTQSDLAEEFGVQKSTIGKWIELSGYEQVPCYVRKEAA